MMPQPPSNFLPDVQQLSESAAIWHCYDPALKAELWSTALRTASGVYVIDPTEVDRAALAEFIGRSPVSGIVVTNENHEREVASFCAAFRAPRFDWSSPSPEGDLISIQIPGAPAGEIALISGTGELVIGDALINFEPYGFTFLPDKYCIDAKQMRESLRTLLGHTFTRILFAHGTPITTNARARLEALLGSSDKRA